MEGTDHALVLAVRGVDNGDLEEGCSDCLDEEVIDGELVLALGGGVEGGAELQELTDREGSGDVVVGVSVLRVGETGCDGLAHGGEGGVGAGSA